MDPAYARRKLPIGIQTFAHIVSEGLLPHWLELPEQVRRIIAVDAAPAILRHQ